MGFAAEVFITTGDRTFLDYPTALHTRTLSRSRGARKAACSAVPTNPLNATHPKTEEIMPATATYNLTGNAYVDGVLGDFQMGRQQSYFQLSHQHLLLRSRLWQWRANRRLRGTELFSAGCRASSLRLVFLRLQPGFQRSHRKSATHADLRIAMSDTPSDGVRLLSERALAPAGGDVWFNNSSGYYDSPVNAATTPTRPCCTRSATRWASSIRTRERACRRPSTRSNTRS